MTNLRDEKIMQDLGETGTKSSAAVRTVHTDGQVEHFTR